MVSKGLILAGVALGLSMFGWVAPNARGAGSTETPTALPMEKYVSKEAIFVLYKPRGWAVTEGAQRGFRTVSVSDPSGRYEAAMFYGTNPAGSDVLALARLFGGGIGRQFPDLALRGAMVSPDRTRVVFDATFTVPRQGKREFRCWVTGAGGEFMYSSIEAPAGHLARMRPVLLTILANVRIFKGAFGTQAVAPVQVPLIWHRLSDGSARFAVPRGWSCQEFGKGCFLAGDGNGYVFMVASVDVLTPRLGVTVPGVAVSDYLRPSRALQFLAGAQGFATNMQFQKVYARPDIARAMGQVYTAGPVTAEEFLYTCDTRAGRCKGYTFGFSFGSRIGTNWNFRHLTVLAPADAFDGFLGTFVSILGSYEIDQVWAKKYVAEGMERLRRLQQQTAAMVAQNARDIPRMMQAAYDERQRSMAYIDYQRTNYIRGQQDWISTMEGGTVYHTDSWGTKNTTTGESWEGGPFNYVNFRGRNPKYNEDMTPINSRALWERHIR